MGSAIFIFGIAGMAVCILLLIILPKIFEKQKNGSAEIQCNLQVY